MKKINFFRMIGFGVLIVLCVSCGPSDKDLYGGDIVDSDEFAYVQGRSSKRGVGINNVLESDIQQIAPGVSWVYNWGSTAAGSLDGVLTANNVEFVPMGWNNYSAAIASYLGSHANSNYALGFNEPNLTDQANMTPQKAAELWPNFVNGVKSVNGKIVSPAMNWGTLSGWADGVKWLDSFFGLVGKDDVSAIAVHEYMTSVSGVLGDVDRYKKFGLPIWLTEFCSWQTGQQPSNATQQMSFMSEILNAMEQDPQIERYAWFMLKGTGRGYALVNTASPYKLTNLGIMYTYMSSFDQEAVYPLGKRIPAEHYRACSVKNTDLGTKATAVAITTDEDGILMLNNFSKGMYADYKVGMGGQKQVELQVRYSNVRNSALDVYTISDSGAETLLASVPLERFDDEKQWATAKVVVNLPVGATVVRLRPSSGTFNVNWFKFTHS